MGESLARDSPVVKGLDSTFAIHVTGSEIIIELFSKEEEGKAGGMGREGGV